MIWRKLILILLTATICGCNLEFEKEKINNPLYGDWVLINADSEYDLYKSPRGFSLKPDTLESFRGFYKREKDSLTGKQSFIYIGNFTSYKVIDNYIYIDSSINNSLGFPWKIEKNTFDSLIVVTHNSRIRRFIHPKYNLNKILPFDKIVYSIYGSYWTTPILDISLDNNGEVLFRGGRFLKQLGFYNGQIDNKTKEYIFNKFSKASILSLNTKYWADATDQEAVVISFIKNGQIIKSISDYGDAFPRELFWACIPLKNLYITNKLNSESNDWQFNLDLYLFAFEKNGLVLPLSKSESFYLQTELINSKIIDTIVNSKLEISFREIYFFLEPDSNNKQQVIVSSIKTDGRLYTFNFGNTKSITFDLGYNFIERNYSKKEFYKPTEGYRW